MFGCGRSRGRGRSSRGRHGAAREQSVDGWEEWGGYMPAKKQKLENQHESIEVASNIFKGISVFVNGYTNPSSDEIKRLVIANGGVFHHYYSRTRVTHIIASNLPTSKINRIRDEKVVKPDWIVDSISAGKLLPFQPYLLYRPQGTGKPSSFFQPKSTADSTESMLIGHNHSDSSAGLMPSHVTSDETAENYDGHNLLSFTTENSLYELTADEEMPWNPSDIESLPDRRHGNMSDVQHAEDVSVVDVELENEPNQHSASTSAEEQLSAENRKRVSEFFSHSRLHYISTWGAEYKAYVAKIQSEEQSTLPGRDRLRQMVDRGDLDATESVQQLMKFTKVVMHIDMDCFFVSVGLRSRPHLRGKPVAVTHSRGADPQRVQSKLSTHHNDAGQPNNSNMAFNSMAEIASCSYEARQAGVKNGMLFGKAKKLCPTLQPIAYDFEAYRSVSQTLYDTVASYTHDIEAVSCDEMFVDCVDLLANTGASPLQFATLLREEMFAKTGCTASVGIGENMLQARMATRVAKPNGQFWLRPGDVVNFMSDKKVVDLPGVGYSLNSKLATLDVVTCGDLQKLSLSTLQKHFGSKTGQTLHDHCRGIDNSLFKTGAVRKSVSAEMNYGIRMTTLLEIDNFLGEFAAEVQGRLARLNRKCRAVTLKLRIRHPDAPKETAKFMGCGVCDSVSKTSTLALPTDSVDIIANECRSLVRMIPFDPSDLRGVAIQLTGLESVQGKAPATGCRSIRDFALPSVPSVTTSFTCTSSTSGCASTSAPTSPSSVATAVSSDDCQGPKSVDQIGLVDMIHRHHDSLPPLPSLADFSMTDANTNQTVANNTGSECGWYLPSFSQIDRSVLHELPADIRANIESALGEKTHQRATLSTAHNVDTHPSVSGNEATGSHNDMLTFSQLDASFMAALPEDIRDEISREYGREKRMESHPEMSKPALMLVRASNTSPSKASSRQTSPRKGTSPFKAPSGHPPARRKYTKRKKPLTTKVKQATTVCAQLSTSSMAPSSSIISHVNQESLPRETVQTVSAAVQESLDDVKTMMREWVTSCDAPSTDDLEEFVSYLVQQIHGCDLERVSLLLKFLKRLTNKQMNSDAWQNGYKWVVEQTQAVMKSTYGGELKMAM